MTDVVKKVLPPKSKGTIRESLFKCYVCPRDLRHQVQISENDYIQKEGSKEYGFWAAYRKLFLFSMRHFYGLTESRPLGAGQYSTKTILDTSKLWTRYELCAKNVRFIFPGSKFVATSSLTRSIEFTAIYRILTWLRPLELFVYDESRVREYRNYITAIIKDMILRKINSLLVVGTNVDLAEAEALHLAATKTTIAVPTLHSAYVLDGVGYIVMSYEEGEEFEKYWDRVSETERDHVLEQLREYLNQMREIKGDYIGRLNNSPCKDGIFLGGYGDYTKYSYGPYPSEESFNEGIVQALRDRLPAETIKRENDLESTFFNGEHELYQTVRSLKNHEIVFTHADLHPGNIIVRADGTVVLLDWGLAGFWPDYWDSYRARHCFHWRVSWSRMLEKFIPPFYLESNLMMRVFATVWH